MKCVALFYREIKKMLISKLHVTNTYCYIKVNICSLLCQVHVRKTSGSHMTEVLRTIFELGTSIRRDTERHIILL